VLCSTFKAERDTATESPPAAAYGRLSAQNAKKEKCPKRKKIEIRKTRKKKSS
jgi:hypothetical protein